jgi:hypothetical protein
MSIERVRAVREAIGPEVKLIADANQSLSVGVRKPPVRAWHLSSMSGEQETVPARGGGVLRPSSV